MNRDVLDENDEFVLDQFHYHEALDRTHLLLDTWVNMVESHWIMPENEDLRMMAIEISSLMSDLYQFIGERADEVFGDVRWRKKLHG